MMKQKLFAAVTAFVCALSAMPAFTAVAEAEVSGKDYLILDVRTNENGVIYSLYLREIGTSYLEEISGCGADMEKLLENQDAPEPGDVITLSAPEFTAEVYPGCLHYTEENPAVMINHGNIEEIGTLESLTIVGYEAYDGKVTECHLEDENNDMHLYYPDEDYGIPAPDVENSEEILCYMYNGEPVLLAEDTSVDPWDVPWTATGIVIGPELMDVSGHGVCFFRETVDSVGDTIGAGDVVKLKLRGPVAESFPAILPDIENIDRIGTAAEVYGYEEYTVTENTGTMLTLTDTAGEAENYYYDLQVKRGYELYNSELVINAQAGDVITFMDDENGDPVVPATQDDLFSRDEFVVIGVDDPEQPQNYVIIASGNPYAAYFLSAKEVEPYLAAGGTPLSYGDIFTVAGGYWCTCFGGTNDFGLEKAETIRIEGSVFDKAETAEFTAISKPNESTYVWLQSAEKNYQYPVDFVLGIGLSLGNVDFMQPDGIDWAKPDVGDKVTMYVYQGVPMVPQALARIGDADGNNEINAGDAGEILLAAAASGTGTQVDATTGFDVNDDGVVNAADASAVLVYAAAQGADAPMNWTEIFGF